ncbi:hypothetical protein CKO12_14350, partial [Chromatium okenii]|uniref:plasmid replication initiator TrfA n=1 Tax=Chromatium okenii TaxID=61644 RepID=UPI00237BB42C
MAQEPEEIDLQAIMARMDARGRGENTAPPRPEDTRVVPLPIWPKNFRGVPNGILRSALFGAIKRGRRAFQNNQRKASLKGVVIKFTGQQLDQADLDVWEFCLHRCRERGLGVKVEFLTYQCLRELKRSCGGSSAGWLRGALNRLLNATVSIEEGRFRYSDTLIKHYLYDDDAKIN